MLYMFLWVTLLAAIGYLYSVPQSKIATRWLPDGKPLNGKTNAVIITAAAVMTVVVLNTIYTMYSLTAVVGVMFPIELIVGGVARHHVDKLGKTHDQMPAWKQDRARQDYQRIVCCMVILRLCVLWLAAVGLIITWAKYF